MTELDLRKVGGGPLALRVVGGFGTQTPIVENRRAGTSAAKRAECTMTKVVASGDRLMARFGQPASLSREPRCGLEWLLAATGLDARRRIGGYWLEGGDA